MNTDINLIIYGEDNTRPTRQSLEQTGEQVKLLFQKIEERLSRFRPESELSRLNRDGHIYGASLLLFQSVQEAVAMAELTGGIFDPTILESLEKAGYDRSFELLGAQPYTQAATFGAWASEGLYREIQLNPANHNIILPRGVRIDLGGIGKGIAVDWASTFLQKTGFKDYAVNAGGDMFLSGHPPEAFAGWAVGVSNPLDPANELTELTVKNQAVATSSVVKRRWQQGGKLRHHLIDPRTGQPVVNNLAAVTVIASITQQADVLAKTALIMGPDEGKAFIQQQPGCSALFVTMNGEIL
jgi:thiamine biosynthesis lipoprotein